MMMMMMMMMIMTTIIIDNNSSNNFNDDVEDEQTGEDNVSVNLKKRTGRIRSRQYISTRAWFLPDHLWTGGESSSM